MSRKTKDTLYKERLTQISECPVDLLHKIEPNEDFFAKIQAAEQGDLSQIRELSHLTYETYKDECEINRSMLYYAKLGMAQRDLMCAVNLLRCVERFNVEYDSADEAISIINNIEHDDDTEQLISRIKAQRIISTVGSGADYDVLLDILSNMCDEYSKYAILYVVSHRLIDTGICVENEIYSLAKSLDLPSLPTLPVFTGKDNPKKETAPTDTGRECEVMRYASTLICADKWRDFWLRALYEYTQIYMDGDLSIIAEDIENAVKLRCDYPKRKLHLLAAKRIISDEGEEINALASECAFNGFDISVCKGEALYETLRDAVYTDSEEEKRLLARSMRLGTEIKHVKNRYSIEATLTNHMKRGIRHLWDATLSIKTELDTAPTIGICKVSTTKNEVVRNGIALDRERKLTQVFCRGEMQIGEKSYPLEIDLIVDISYVSSTKCELCEIKTKSYHRDGDYLVIGSTISIY